LIYSCDKRKAGKSGYVDGIAILKNGHATYQPGSATAVFGMLLRRTEFSENRDPARADKTGATMES